MTPVLGIEDVSKVYARGAEEIRALADVNLTAAPGEILALVGRSGSGKTSLLHVAGGLATPDAGVVAIDGVRLSEMGAADRAVFRRRSIGFIFQFFCLIPTLTAVENVALPLNFDRRRDATRIAGAALEQVELGHRLHHLPSQLSGGEMQRVAVARALVMSPRVVLADEPTGNLDTANSDQVMALLSERVRASGGALLIATHDHGIADRADRVIELSDGRATERC